jgi:hypothetical protein
MPVISRPTVFVLGAGASLPFGLPSTSELKTEIQNNLRVGNQVGQLAEATQMSARLLAENARQLASELEASQLGSVDQFLESNRRGEQYLLLARPAIAQVLLPRESPAQIHAGPDWLGDLYLRLIELGGIESLGQHRISFITFNYDRSLEFYLFSSVKGATGWKDSEVAGLLQDIEILHMYGSLGPLPWQAGTDRAISYGVDQPDGLTIRLAMRGLRLIGDTEDPGQFDRAKELIRNAEQVFFMGFGFGEANLRRLVPEDLMPSAPNFKGSYFQESEGKKKDIDAMFQRLTKGRSIYLRNSDNKDFLGWISLTSLIHDTD